MAALKASHMDENYLVLFVASVVFQTLKKGALLKKFAQRCERRPRISTSIRPESQDGAH